MANSNIISIDFKREITSEKYGTTNVYKMELSDGTKGDFMCKNKDALPVVGQELEYEFTPPTDEKYDGRIKEIKKKSFQGFSKKSEKAENARTALIVAKDLVIAGKVKGEASTKEVAQKLFEWLESKSN
jgi:fructose-bisphosphate aldolase class 1